jgi:hypothetical protein
MIPDNLKFLVSVIVCVPIIINQNCVSPVWWLAPGDCMYHLVICLLFVLAHAYRWRLGYCCPLCRCGLFYMGGRLYFEFVWPQYRLVACARVLRLACAIYHAIQHDIFTNTLLLRHFVLL